MSTVQWGVVLIIQHPFAPATAQWPTIIERGRWKKQMALNLRDLSIAIHYKASFSKARDGDETKKISKYEAKPILQVQMQEKMNERGQFWHYSVIGMITKKVLVNDREMRF